MSTKSGISFNDQPFFQLVDAPISEMNEHELRAFIQATNEKVQSPQRRRADANKESKQLSTKKPQVNMVDMFKQDTKS